jgi:hypothetical protein
MIVPGTERRIRMIWIGRGVGFLSLGVKECSGDATRDVKRLDRERPCFWSAVTCHRFSGCDLSQPMTINSQVRSAATGRRENKAVTGHRTPKKTLCAPPARKLTLRKPLSIIETHASKASFR